MKKFLIICAGILFITGASNAQSVLTVQPGLQLSGFSYGIQKGKTRWFGGFQYLGIADKFKDKSNGDVDKSGVSILMPYLGLKRELRSEEAVTMYYKAAGFKPIIIEKDSGLDSEIGLWAMETGIGAEYRFAEQFSLGGECGIRLGLARESDEFSANSFQAHMMYTAMTLNFFFSKKE